jgi:transcriptional regulator of met regulon
LDWHLCRMAILELLAQPHSSIPYVHMGKKSIEHKTCALILSTSVRKFLILRRTERDIINVHTHVKRPLCVSEFNVISIFSNNIRKILKYQISF